MRTFKSLLTISIGALAVLSSAMLISAPSAHAVMGVGPTLSVIGGLNQTVSTGGSTGYVAGARLGVGLGLADLDISAAFRSRGFDGFSNVNSLSIPVVIRFPLVPAFSIGAGGYYDAAITNNAAKVYGIRGSIQFGLIGTPLFVEGNYDHNLGEGSSGSVKDLQAVIGFKL
jgi:hypothetical protein